MTWGTGQPPGLKTCFENMSFQLVLHVLLLLLSETIGSEALMIYSYWSQHELVALTTSLKTDRANDLNEGKQKRTADATIDLSNVYGLLFFSWGSQSKVWNQVGVRESMTLQKADCCTESLTHHIVTLYYFTLYKTICAQYRCISLHCLQLMGSHRVIESPCHLTGLHSWRIQSQYRISQMFGEHVIHLFHKRTEKIYEKICEKIWNWNVKTTKTDGFVRRIGF